MRPAPFVTISRQYGCAAYTLAQRLAQRLDREFPHWEFTVYDRKLLEVIAEREPLTADLVRDLSRRTRGMVSDWLDDLSGKPAEFAVVRHLVRAMCATAALGQTILVGRGGAVITRKLPRGVHVRLIAPLEWRLQRLQRDPDHAAQATADAIRRADREREEYVRRYLGADVADPELYHLILNAQLVTQQEQVEAIAALVREKVGVAEPVAATG